MVSVTPDQFKKVGMGLSPSPSPFLTPRPERRRPDSRGSDRNPSRQDKDKETNVQVLLRCRSLIAYSVSKIYKFCFLTALQSFSVSLVYNLSCSLVII